MPPFPPIITIVTAVDFFVMELAARLSALERSNKEIIDHWEQCRVVRGDGCPGRGSGLVEEDNDDYQSRMDSPPDDVVAAMSLEVTRE